MESRYCNEGTYSIGRYWKYISLSFVVLLIYIFYEICVLDRQTQIQCARQIHHIDEYNGFFYMFHDYYFAWIAYLNCNIPITNFIYFLLFQEHTEIFDTILESYMYMNAGDYPKGRYCPNFTAKLIALLKWVAM